jgi:hypothetical protein
MGHFIKSAHTVRQINEGKLEVPNELKQALKDPECQRAFNGGSIGPDLVETKSHYGKTADLSQRMLETARADMKRAAGARNQEAFNEAKKDLAFAYGWLHHCAADLNTHPKVNERVGDTYRFLEKGGKLAHGAMEGQETTYLKQTLWNPEDKYDVYVPAKFLSKVTGVPADDIVEANKTLKRKALVELFETGKVTLSHEELKRLWETTVRNGQHDAADFLRDPSKLKNWDLDCGRITTEDFDSLRRTVMTLNGGKLPEGWAKNYLAWHEATQGLSREQMTAKLKQLAGIGPAEPLKPKGDTKAGTGKANPVLTSGGNDRKALEARMNALRERHRDLKRVLDASGGHDAATSREMREVYQEYLEAKQRFESLKK